MIYTIAVSIISFSFLALVNYTIFTFIFRKSKQISHIKVSRLPKVSILKPFKNIDDEIEINLVSFYETEYPDFEVIFGVDTIEEGCVSIIKNVSARYAHIKTKIIPTGHEKKLNPKVDILAKLAVHSSGELYWVADSNTRIEKNTLKNLVHAYSVGNAKIVFSPIRGTGSKTAGSVLENAYMNFFVSANVIVGWQYFKRAIIVGKSMLIEKAALESLGGFTRFEEYLAEDFMMGEIFKENGMALSMNFTWVTNFNSTATIKNFCSRISRWAKMRYHIDRFFYISEILTNPIGITLCFLPFLGSQGPGFLAAVVLFKILLEYINFVCVNETDRKKIWILVSYPFLIVLKDILLLFIYVIPFFSGTVKWRGRKIKIGKNSRIFPV